MTTETIPLTQDHGGARPDGPGSQATPSAAGASSPIGADPSRKIAIAAIYAWARQVLADQYEADDMAGVAAILRAGGDGHLPTQTALHAMVKFAAMYPRGEEATQSLLAASERLVLSMALDALDQCLDAWVNNRLIEDDQARNFTSAMMAAYRIVDGIAE